MTLIRLGLSAMLAVLLLAVPTRSFAAGSGGMHAASTRALQHPHIPIAFEVNQGQTNRQVQFLAHASGSTVYLTRTGITLALMQSTHLTSRSLVKGPMPRTQPSHLREVVLRLLPVGMNRQVRITGSDLLPGRVNYFIGSNPKDWHTNIPTYGSVTYHNVYPHIDLRFYGGARGLEYDWVIRPGGNPNRIAMTVQGGNQTHLHLDRQGNLRMGPLTQDKPVVYQVIGGTRHLVNGHILLGSQRMRFQVGAYDHARTLVIDPLVYSTYLGGSDNDQGYSIAVDSSGNAYVTGLTTSSNFPVTAGAFQTTNPGGYDAFVTKLNASGSGLGYSTYLGGSSYDYGYGVAVDSSGNAYVTGATASTNFPVTAGAFQTTNAGNSDAFVTKLNASGTNLVYSTYLGGSDNDQGYGIALDSSGNAYVTGRTTSTNFPVTTGAFQTTNAGNYDAFVTKLNASGSGLLYSTYLGGSSYDYGYGIAVDSSGNAYVTGPTSSTNFPVTTGAFQTTYAGNSDAFVTKLTAPAAPTITKSFGAASMSLNGTTSLTFTITNPNATTSLTGVGFTDTLPSGLVVATPNGLTGSCGAGTITAVAGSSSISLSGATLAPSSSCTFSVNVTATSTGTKNNTTSTVSSNEGGSGNAATASMTVTLGPPTIAKAFGATSIPVNGTTSLTFTITNPTGNDTLIGISFTDILPSGLVVATPNGLTGSCGGGTITATAGSSTISLSGATLEGGATCTFSVNVTATSVGTKINAVTVTSTNGGNGNTATASISVHEVITPAGQNLSCTEGVTCSGPVATFTNNGSQPCSAYTASIDYGDGTVATSDTITSNTSGGCTVTGSHVYAEDRATPYPITTTISNASTGASASTTSSATVADAAVSAAGHPLTCPAGTTCSGTYATFTDSRDPTACPSPTVFTATIDYGIGAGPQPGTVTYTGPTTGGCGYIVTGSATYPVVKTYTATIRIYDDGGTSAVATTTSTITITRPSSSIGGCRQLGVVGSYNGVNTSYPSQGYTPGVQYTLNASYPAPNASLPGVLGSLTYTDTRAGGISIPNGIIDAIVATPGSSTVTLYGHATSGGVTTTFTITMTGTASTNGTTTSTPNPDTFTIQTSTGYSATVIQPPNSIMLKYLC